MDLPLRRNPELKSNFHLANPGMFGAACIPLVASVSVGSLPPLAVRTSKKLDCCSEGPLSSRVHFSLHLQRKPGFRQMQPSVLRAASVTSGSNRSFSATQQHQLKGVVTPILTAQSRLLLCHLMPRKNFVSDLWGNHFVGRHYHLPKGRPLDALVGCFHIR
jgi:hypothetical protein